MIKDYAKPLTVTAGAQQLLFYKYFLVDDAEAETLIKSALGLAPKEPEKIKKAEERPIEKKETKEKEEKKEPVKETRREEKKESVEKATPEHTPETPKKERVEKKKAPKSERPVEQQTLAHAENAPAALPKDEFLKKISDYCAKSGIVIKSAAVLKKNADLDLVIVVPSPVGAVEYYCKARAKKKSSEQDIAAALEQGMQRKLATIYLTTGEVGKKGKEYAQASRVIVKEL